MKKILSIAIMCCILLSCAFTLLACGNSVSGTYKASLLGTDVVYEFGSFGNVIIRIDYPAGEDTVIEGKYELSEDGNEITFIFEANADNEDKVEEYSGTFNFAKGEDKDGNKYVKIGLVTYTEYKK